MRLKVNIYKLVHTRILCYDMFYDKNKNKNKIMKKSVERNEGIEEK